MVPDKRHTVVFGQSGSGKTGAVIAMCEAALRAGISCVLIDIKGDLANILTSRLPGVSYKLVTPGSLVGHPLCLLNKLYEKDSAMSGIQNLLTLLGLDASKFQASYASLLFAILDSHDFSRKCTIRQLIQDVMHPPFGRIGTLPVDVVITPAKREDLAVRLNNLALDDSMAAWMQGGDYAFETMQQPTCVVVSVAHLTDQVQQDLAVNYTLDSFCKWTWSLPGVDATRALLVVDECAGLLPPYPKNPLSKQHLMSLVKRGRAFGNGVILATQNPKDVDYKALSNCNTWVVGRLLTTHDRKRVLEAMPGVPANELRNVENQLAVLPCRDFFVIKDSRAVAWRSPDVVSVLSGPMVAAELSQFAPVVEKPSFSVKSLWRRAWNP